MGRRKISIAPIQDERNRQVTFLKRKNGLFKKAYELGVLCSADVAVVVFNANGKLFEFHSGDMDRILLRYSHYAGPPHEKRGPEDYTNKDLAEATKKGTGGKMTSLSDEDDEDEDDEPRPAMGSSGVRAIPASKGKQAIKAAQERKAKEASLSRAVSEDAHGAPSLSRSNSQSSQHQTPYLQQQPPPTLQPQPNGYPQPGAPNLGYPAAGTPQLPQQTLPQNPSPFGFPNLPNFPGLQGLAMPPAMPTAMPGMPGWPPLFAQPPQASTSNGGAGGVPAWFGAPNPQAMSAAPQLWNPLGGQQAVQHLSNLLQSGSGMGDPNGLLQQLQQQQLPQPPQLPHQQQPPSGHNPHLQPQPPAQHSSPYPAATPQQHISSPPQLAPMYGSPAAQSQSYAGSPEDLALAAAAAAAAQHGQAQSRPGSVVPLPPSRQNSLNASKPRLSVSIPEGEKAPGLVTAGGASILGAGLGVHGMSQEPEAIEDESGQATAVPKSAFAADLLPSPFYPGGAPSTLPAASFPFPAQPSSVFTWPTSAVAPVGPVGPAPALGATDAPDLLRRASAESGQSGGQDALSHLSAAAMLAGEGGVDDGGMVRSLKRGSVDLEEGIENMAVGGVGHEAMDGDGTASEVSDGNGGRRKRRA
ncbi:hypothetical protein JCM10207_001657 [Rhodosporidiobolus poonsookiae]